MRDRAKRATILIGNPEVYGFQIPDDSYRVSQASAAKAILEAPFSHYVFYGKPESKRK